MNDVYFFCTDCKKFIDAADRWAVHTLETPGIVRLKECVDVSEILAVDEYFRPPEEKYGPRVSIRIKFGKYIENFLIRHKEHNVIYNEFEFLLNNYDYLEWFDEGDTDGGGLPRNAIEQLNITTWESYIEHIEGMRFEPHWYGFDEQMEKAKEVFELIASKKDG